MLSAAFLRGNSVTLRTQKVIQGGDNSHVGRPCEVSLAPPCPELFCELRGLCRHSYFGPRTCSRSERPMSSKWAGSQSGFPKKPFSPLMSTFAVSSQHKDAEYRPLVVGMIDSDWGRCNANVPRHLPNKLEYKVLICISVYYQSRMTSNGIANTPSRFHSAGRAIWGWVGGRGGGGGDAEGGGVVAGKGVRCMTRRGGGWLQADVYAACSVCVGGLS